MSTAQKRRINVASFSMSDVSKSHLAVLALGTALVLAGVGSAWVSASNSKAAADGKLAGRLMSSAATQAADGAKFFSNGGSSKLFSAASGGNAINTAFNELALDQGPAVSSLRDVSATAAGAWSSFSASMGDVWTSLSSASELSVMVGSSASNFAKLAKTLDGTVYKKEFESAVRLYSYAEAGFGVASAPRVDYDLRVLAGGLDASEFKSSISFIEPMLAPSKVAAGRQLTKDQLRRVSESAIVARSAADSLSAASAQSAAAGMWLMAAAAFALAGLALSWVAVVNIVGDVGRRYLRVVQQFRAGEEDRAELVGQIRNAAGGDAQLISLSNPASEFLDIAGHVNRLMEMQVRRLTDIRESAESAGLSHATALDLVASTEAAVRSAVEKIDGAIGELGGAAALAHLTRLDAQAATFAASEASARSTDANRMSQDAASRLDALREGLQETSKGVKRLGERTQEINAVVDAMEVLSEQIGVLALNANLEAERAGDAGAGFRLVAREVQAVARKSEDALTRISKLIQGAQADARAAAESVERSTSQVVSGSNISAVSQAFLVTLAPLANGVSATTRSIADTTKDGEESLERAAAGLRGALAAANDAFASVAKARAPMSAVQGQLEMAGGQA